jgi:hypothetical protein
MLIECRTFASATRKPRLLPELDHREFAAADAAGETLDELRHRIFAVGADEFRERGEQARLRQAIAIDAIVTRFRPGLVEIIEGGALLILIGQKAVSGRPMGRMRHEIK